MSIIGLKVDRTNGITESELGAETSVAPSRRMEGNDEEAAHICLASVGTGAALCGDDIEVELG
jgi:hypothetical protein